MTNASCQYCGDAHDVRDLCRARAAGLSRRRFLFLGGMAAAAAILPIPDSTLFPAPQQLVNPVGTSLGLSREAFEAWYWKRKMYYSLDPAKNYRLDGITGVPLITVP